jgi:hypothetical protein
VGHIGTVYGEPFEAHKRQAAQTKTKKKNKPKIIKINFQNNLQ